MTGTVMLLTTRTFPSGGGGARGGGGPGGTEGRGGAPGVGLTGGGVGGGEGMEGTSKAVQSVMLSSQGDAGGEGIEGGAGGEEGGDVGGEETLPTTSGAGTSEAAVTISAIWKVTLSWTQKPKPLLQVHVSPSSSHARQQVIAPVSRSTSIPAAFIYVPEFGRGVPSLSTTLICCTVQVRGTRLRDSDAGMMISPMTYIEPMKEPKVRIPEMSAAIQ
mmetsp:Transcript_26021/g.62098  ORF Transcript_26021/g.62098 Transcript_26021/m.62098 type:complete len:217 (-) Transcript_26021:270-920(-)